MDFFCEPPRAELTRQQRDFVSSLFPELGTLELTNQLPAADPLTGLLPPPLFRSQSSRSSGGAGASAGGARHRGATFDAANVLVKKEPGLEAPDEGAGDGAEDTANNRSEEEHEEDAADDREGGFGRGGGSSKRRRLGLPARALAHHASLAGFDDSAAPSLSVQQWESRLWMLDRFVAQGISLPQSLVEHLIERMMDSPERVDFDSSQAILAGLSRILAVQPQALICTSAHAHLLCTLTTFVDATFGELLDHVVLSPSQAKEAAEVHVARTLPAQPTLADRLTAAQRVSALLSADSSSRDRTLTMLRKYLLVHRLFLTLFLEDARITEVWNETQGEEENSGSSGGAAAASSSSSSAAAVAAAAPSAYLSRELAGLISPASRRGGRSSSAHDPHDDSFALFSCFQLNARPGEKLFDWRSRLQTLEKRLQAHLAETRSQPEATAVPTDLVSEWLMYVHAGWLELIKQMDEA